MAALFSERYVRAGEDLRAAGVVFLPDFGLDTATRGFRGAAFGRNRLWKLRDQPRGAVYIVEKRKERLEPKWSKFNRETRANRYASDLLMPDFMFRPKATALNKVDFETVKSLAQVFETSLTAAAIRLVEHGPLPSMLVCSSCDGVEWFVPGDCTKPLRPMNPGLNTFARDIFFGGEKEAAGDVLASAWFEHEIPDRYRLSEHSIRGSQDRVLSLLWWKNEKMLMDLDDYEERRAAKRWDDRD